MLNEHQKKLVKMIQGLGAKYSTWSVFNDFLTMAATAISNAVDPVHREEREKLYMEAIGHYRKDEQSVFPEMFTVLVQAADQAMATEGPKDILGAVFHDLELHNKYKGQFFYPAVHCRHDGTNKRSPGTARRKGLHHAVRTDLRQRCDGDLGRESAAARRKESICEYGGIGVRLGL